MEDQVKEILEAPKRRGGATLPVPYSQKAKKNVKRQQGCYMQKHGKSISAKKLAGILLETASLPK